MKYKIWALGSGAYIGKMWKAMILLDTASCGGHDKNKHNKIVPILQKKRFGVQVSMYLLWIWIRINNQINIDTCRTYRHSNKTHDGGRLQKMDTCSWPHVKVPPEKWNMWHKESGNKCGIMGIFILFYFILFFWGGGGRHGGKVATCHGQ